MYRILCAMLIAAALLQACYNDKRDQLYPTPVTTGCDTSNVTYSGFVKGVMSASCSISGCHDAATAADGYVLDSYAGVKTIASSGKLVGSISHASGYIAMPQGRDKLDDCTIAKISAWVAKGAPNN